jgi:hypothetical protein
MESNCNIEGPNMDITGIHMEAKTKHKTNSEEIHMSTASWSTTGQKKGNTTWNQKEPELSVT